jgi:hypothetical protein
MKSINIAQVLSLCLALLAGSASAVLASDKPYYGDYRVESVTRYRGGLTTDSQAKSFIGGSAHIGGDRFSIRNISIDSPIYKAYSISVKNKEGSVVPQDTSVFYGYRDDRSEVRRLDVFRNIKGHPGPYPEDTLEELDRDTLLEMYDGWFILLKRKN